MPNPDLPLSKIISGGQTGADRAALDAALDAGFPCGGWCPNGRKDEDGKIPPRYPLQENSTTSYADRIWLNVNEADGTLVVSFGEPIGGSAYTLECAAGYRLPHLHIDAQKQTPAEAARQVQY